MAIGASSSVCLEFWLVKYSFIKKCGLNCAHLSQECNAVIRRVTPMKMQNGTTAICRRH